VSHNAVFDMGGATGGGIFAEGAALTLDNVTVANNSAFYAGGLYLEEAVTVARGLACERNFARSVWGGGYMLGGELNVSRSVVTGNVAAEAGGFGFDTGGGLRGVTTSVRAVFDGVAFDGNVATVGAGGGLLLASGASTTVVNCTFSNHVADVGGAVALELGSSARLEGCVFRNNHAASGGAVSHVGSGRLDAVRRCVEIKSSTRLQCARNRTV
jgi:hypothetical protein